MNLNKKDLRKIMYDFNSISNRLMQADFHDYNSILKKFLMTNKLTHHLLLVSDSCENYYKELMENYIKNDERLSEKSKELNPLEWTKLMNNYKNTAEEIVLNEYVFI